MEPFPGLITFFTLFTSFPSNLTQSYMAFYQRRALLFVDCLKPKKA